MDPVTITTLASGPGAWMIASGLIMALKAEFGPYWSDLLNRLAIFLLPVALIEFAMLASASITHTPIMWYAYVLGALNAIMAGVATTSTQRNYDAKLAKK